MAKFSQKYFNLNFKKGKLKHYQPVTKEPFDKNNIFYQTPQSNQQTVAVGTYQFKLSSKSIFTIIFWT